MSSLDPITIILSPSPAPSQELDTLADLCAWMVEDNVRWMERAVSAGRAVPCSVACARIRYIEPPRSCYEGAVVRIQGAAQLLGTRIGACGSLACYDAAAARVLGHRASVQIVVPRGAPPHDYHAIVTTSAGSWDPSLERSPLCGCRSSRSA